MIPARRASEGSANALPSADFGSRLTKSTTIHLPRRRIDSIVVPATTAFHVRFQGTRSFFAPGRTAWIVAGVLVFAILCGVIVAQAAGRRDSGQEVSGDVPQSARERNTQCLNEARSDPQAAIRLIEDSPGGDGFSAA